MLAERAIRQIRAMLPTTCCGRTPPEFLVVCTSQLLHVLCSVCLRYHAVFTTFMLRANIDGGERSVRAEGVRRTIREWCAITGIPEARVQYRIATGWSPARAVTQPCRSYSPNEGAS
jgi:hypothetical protein